MMSFYQPSFFELDISPEFGHWFAGFVDGEGYFNFRCVEKKGNGEYRAIESRLVVALRRDDINTLKYIQNNLQIGNINLTNKVGGNQKPQAAYQCNRTSDLKHVIVPLFEQYPLRSKKARDFEIWKQAVEIKFALPRGKGVRIPKYLWHKLRQLEFELKAIRQYVSPTEATGEF